MIQGFFPDNFWPDKIAIDSDTYESFRRNVWSRFATNWGSNSEIEYDGIPFTTPATGYVKLSIVEGPSEQINFGTINSNTFRYLDIIQVDVYSPNEQSPTQINTLIDLVVPIFKGITFNGITVRDLSIFRGSLEGWDVRTLSFETQRDKN